MEMGCHIHMNMIQMECQDSREYDGDGVSHSHEYDTDRMSRFSWTWWRWGVTFTWIWYRWNVKILLNMMEMGCHIYMNMMHMECQIYMNMMQMECHIHADGSLCVGRIPARLDRWGETSGEHWTRASVSVLPDVGFNEDDVTPRPVPQWRVSERDRDVQGSQSPDCAMYQILCWLHTLKVHVRESWYSQTIPRPSCVVYCDSNCLNSSSRNKFCSILRHAHKRRVHKRNVVLLFIYCMFA